MKVLGYRRVSSDEQAHSGLSIEAQEIRIRDYAKLHGHELVGIETDAGRSGKNLNREGLKRALRSLKEHQAEGLLVAKLDRLTRSVGDISHLMKSYFSKEGGSHLLSAGEQLDPRTANGRFMIVILVAFAQCEQESTVERTEIAVERKRSKGERIGTIPYGLMLDETNLDHRGRAVAMIPNPAEVEVLDLMRRKVEYGEPLRAIANELNRQGIPTRNPKSKWHHSTLSAILKRIEKCPKYEVNQTRKSPSATNSDPPSATGECPRPNSVRLLESTAESSIDFYKGPT